MDREHALMIVRCYKEAILPLVSDEEQHQSQDDPQLAVVRCPADDRQHRVQKAAAQMGLDPVQDAKFHCLHGTPLCCYVNHLFRQK